MPTTFAGLVNEVIGIINIIIPLIFGILFLYLVWRVFENWVLKADDQNAREAGRQYAVSAVIVFVVMISAWGIVRLLQSSLFGL
jgi:heme O synthase-like polyprenyltransferase